MKKSFLLLAVALLMLTACQRRSYESVPNDPLKTRIYTLDNGLKVYLSVNKDEPRIQTYITVRAGGKNDPAETTGLAHYLEHIMFKGTNHFGTTNYEAEKPLLDSIRNLYEVYRQTTDATARKAIYHRIDSISYAASQLAIANEYDRLMAAIGSDNSNASTSRDYTNYQENIPKNELENWAIVQSDRFRNMVIRGFHTELEAVYEEYNRSLNDDNSKAYDKLSALLYPHHPYGQQTVIGTQEHLKNPSIVNIEKYFRQYYVPNNIAICMSGDLDYDETMDIIEKYFGDWQRGDDVPTLDFQPETPITSPLKAQVQGLESEMVMMGWRFPGTKSHVTDTLTVISELLWNGKAGLFDLDLNQKIRVLQSAAFLDNSADYSTFIALAMPKEGQTLEEARQLLLGEVAKIRRGDFDESLLQAIVNNLKLNEMRSLEDNETRADQYVEAFSQDLDWKDEVESMERISRLTKQDIVNFAKRHLTDHNYAYVEKLQGVDPDQKKIDKPQISPIELNRDKQSDFVEQIIARKVEPIEPRFVDFNNDLTTSTFENGDTLLYKKNEQNGTFSLSFEIERGWKSDPLLPIATGYFNNIGSDQLSAEMIQNEFYRLACNADVTSTPERIFITVNGLAENEAAALQLLEDWMAHAKPDQDVYNSYIDNVLLQRVNSKSDEYACFSNLRSYCYYAPHSLAAYVPSADVLRQTSPQVLLNKLKELSQYRQTICYYGPSSQKDITALIQKYHPLTANPKPASPHNFFTLQPTPQNEVYLAPFNSKAIRMAQISINGERFSPDLAPSIALFNSYFGGGMNTVVFQELRESRGLAYQASASYNQPSRITEPNYFSTFIISQNDKMADCIDVFHQIIENMPVNDGAFKLAKESLLKSILSPVRGESVLSYVKEQRRLGYDHDPNSDIYNKVQQMTLADLTQFAKQHVRGRTYKYVILGNEEDLDMKKLESIGPVHRLSLEEIFGY